MALKIGDLVQLKSGGPIMTITNIGADILGNPRFTCVWFDKEHKENDGTYPAAVLDAVTGEKPMEPFRED